MRAVKQLARKRSMQVAHSVEERWRESEQKAKAFERTRKASFNQARKLSQRVCASSVVDFFLLIHQALHKTNKKLI